MKIQKVLMTYISMLCFYVFFITTHYTVCITIINCMIAKEYASRQASIFGDKQSMTGEGKTWFEQEQTSGIPDEQD